MNPKHKPLIVTIVFISAVFYLIFFSGGKSNEPIQVIDTVLPVVAPKSNALSSAYEVMSAKDKLCVKDALGSDFDKVLKDPDSHLAYNVIENMNKCFSAGVVKPARGR